MNGGGDGVGVNDIQLIDPADRSTWPSDVRAEAERLAVRCRQQPDNTSCTPAYELSLGHVDASYEAEARFRDVVGDRFIALFHATRLLPHELEAVRHEGLVVLTKDHRNQRLDRVIELYADYLGAQRLECLRHSGPLSWRRGDGRLGVLFGVTPLQVAFDDAGEGMTVFLSHWGGESFYWSAKESSDLKKTIQLLTERSSPAIVEVGVRARSLNTYGRLWPVFVAQLDRWRQPWHEYWTQESIPPEHVVTILDPRSDRWPLSPGAP
jgi:hypothetical protein